MLNAVVKLLFALLLLCLGFPSVTAGEATVEVGKPPFTKLYVIEAKICPMGEKAAGIECKTLRSRRTDFGYHCNDRIQISEPVMQQFIALPPGVFGFPTENFDVHLSCILVSDGSDEGL